MSPEQAEGRYKIQDGRSDLYSMGVVLYLLLHGRMPELGKNPNERTIDDVLDKRLSQGSPDRPVPARLSEIIERAVADESRG